MFDFATLDTATACETPFEFEIRRPDTGAGLGVFVSVIGMQGATMTAYARQEANAARIKAYEAERTGKALPVQTLEDDEESILKALAKCMTGWRTVIEGKSKPVIVVDGEEVPFSPAAALDWLRRFRWVREQVAAVS